MSTSDRDKWNTRYRAGAYADRVHASQIVAEQVPNIHATQRAAADAAGRKGLGALDLACGAGRNALYLAGLGYRVQAVDISREALQRGEREALARKLPIRWIEHDLDQGPPRGLGLFDLIVLVRYLDLSLLGVAAEHLRPGGYLLCEAHLVTDRAVIGPHDPNFRARSGELRKAALGLTEVEYWEGLTRDPDGRAVALARLVAWRPYPSVTAPGRGRAHGS